MKPTAVVTIVSNNYLHFARTLLQSVARQHPQAQRYCVIVDQDQAPALELADEFQLLTLDEIGLPDGNDFLYQYTVLELNTAVKPWAMQHLLKQGHSHVLYIDPDIRLYRPLTEVFDLLVPGDEQQPAGDIVFTPHLLQPVTDDMRPTELDIRKAGTYNLGFCAVRNTTNVHRYLEWWQAKLRYDCVVAFERGIFVDQSWMDLVPGLFDNVRVLRHPGYNVAYWNMAQRPITQADDGQVLVDGEPLVFFHYSGLNPRSPHNVSKHQNRFTYDNLNPVTKSLFEGYAQATIANGVERYSRMPYGFDRYTDGTKITAAERARFRTDPALKAQCGGHPFDRADLLSAQQVPALAPQAAVDLQVDPVHIHRLQYLYDRLLGRAPEIPALLALGPRMGSKAGMARTVLSVGLSPEARRSPGWLVRLVRMTNEVHLTPQPIKQYLTAPLGRMLDSAGKRWPSLAYRPAGVQNLSAYPAAGSPGPAGTRMRHAPEQVPRHLAAPPGINLVGYLKAELGVGEAARSLARACTAVGVPFSGVDVGYQSSNLQRDDSVVRQAVEEYFPIDLLYVNADQTATTAQQIQLQGHKRAPYTIAFWHWEQPELPAHHLAAFAHVDEVWVPSTFVQDAVAAVSPVPVFKVPHALSFAPTPGVTRSQFGLPQDKTLVLVMYDFHSYQFRKNPQAAVQAWRQAAAMQPELTLVLKTINSQHHPEAFAALQASVRELPNVIFINDFLTRQQVWDLQSVCDILLSLHRAEGFGLGPAEMMYLGKPVVATGWSANMDFMTAENSMPVRYTLKPLAQDVGAYPAGPVWAEADTDHAAECLVRLAQDPALRQQIGERAAHDIRAQLSPQAVGRQIRQRLQVLGHWYPQLLQLPETEAPAVAKPSA